MTIENRKSDSSSSGR